LKHEADLHEAGLSRSIDEFTTPTKGFHDRHNSIRDDTKSTRGGSLFGGPIGINSDLEHIRSPPRTPLSAEPKLNTIAETSPEETHVRQQSPERPDSRPLEHGPKAAGWSGTPHGPSHHRVRSPLAQGPRHLGLVSSDDFASRLAWPEVDDENHTVNLDSSAGRNKPSALTTDGTRQHEQERRSVSGASARSNDSINAIIRSPETQPPGTPPVLRHVDRSVSSDLRAANRSSATPAGAKKLTKPNEPAPRGAEAEPPLASSSTHDAAARNGIVAMADVYVSNPPPAQHSDGC
jgi:hypothetical protein